MNAQMKRAISEAMERQVAFSWKKTRKVQKGVWLEYNQDHYCEYVARV
jgi:hypothetical protein